MTQIIDAYLGLMALRQAGYRSTATAIAELVDNSIEADADRIDIIAVSAPVQMKTRVSNQVQKVAVLDNGDGMPPHILENCLSLGWGTRLDTRDGLGRFGFGLKGASISQARIVEVYSWISRGEVYRARLDLDEIEGGSLQELQPIEKASLPKIIRESFDGEIEDTGTLVVWDYLDQMDLKRVETLLTRINKELCRIYRHFLDNCDVYGRKRHVKLHQLQQDSRELVTVELKANDPLYWLKPNNLPGFETESSNEIFDEPFSLNVPYLDGDETKTAKVEFRFSIAKPEIQNLGGGSDLGKHYLENTGISFVRAGREIDFGAFGFLDVSDSRHRWWGAEVRFDPVLDELFGVTNNKQEIRSIKKLEDEVLQSMAEEAEHGDHKAFLLVQLNKILSEQISRMMTIIKGRRAGERSKKAKTGSLAGKVNDQIKGINNTPTESSAHADKLTEEQKIEERVKSLLADNSNLGESEAREEAIETLDYRVDILTDSWPGDLFLDRRPVANASIGIINRDTNFYEKFWVYLEGQEDKKGFEALEVIMMALVRAEDELVLQYDKRIFERYRSKWSEWVEQLIDNAAS
jgi:Histidine kinase-, DNA gyrase B-, and HSP90-like ATPase